MAGNSGKKTAKHATRATTSAPPVETAGATDPPSGAPEVAGGNETFATPQAQGIGRQAGVTDGKIDQSENSKTEVEPSPHAGRGAGPERLLQKAWLLRARLVQRPGRAVRLLLSYLWQGHGPQDIGALGGGGVDS